MATPGARNLSARPPERGSFPLDHFGECLKFYETHVKCLEDNDGNARACRKTSESYLKCRMEVGLMRKEPVEALGLGGEDPAPSTSKPRADDSVEDAKTGFVAGKKFAQSR
eukprot:GFYU01034287.1.p2 GENE.GFYU01034287.1~~GFYU01034287.1.p2  ORF type:complete len:111 (-),score=12.28 GFYU01034287.1:149-481(-)